LTCIASFSPGRSCDSVSEGAEEPSAGRRALAQFLTDRSTILPGLDFSLTEAERVLVELCRQFATNEICRISIAAPSLSLTQVVLNMAADYALQRHQFGRPISQSQAVQFKLADIATEPEGLRWLTYRAAYLRDTGHYFSKRRQWPN
jgi:hypothetical protein